MACGMGPKNLKPQPSMSVLGQKADIDELSSDVCFAPESRHRSDIVLCPLSATNGHQFGFAPEEERTL
jgi:hypothetical protein